PASGPRAHPHLHSSPTRRSSDLTAADTCQNGICVGNAALLDGAACDDDNACTSNDTCEGGVCAGTPEPDSTPCDDGNACTTGDTDRRSTRLNSRHVEASPADDGT